MIDEDNDDEEDRDCSVNGNEIDINDKNDVACEDDNDMEGI